MPKEPRIWQYEVTDVGGSMDGRVEIGETILDRWQGHSHTYQIFNLPNAALTGWFTVKLLGEASDEQATGLRENWRKAREKRRAASTRRQPNQTEPDRAKSINESSLGDES